MGKPKADYAIQTVGNALRVLEAFRDDPELGVTELSRRLALHKNNVFRLLATLEQRGYIEQRAENDCYRLGIACLDLAHAYAHGGSLIQRARPLLEELAERAGETAHLAVMREFAVAHLDGVQPEQLVMSGLRLGMRLPVHCTALGKVLLGCASDKLRESYDRRVAQGAALERFTQATIVDAHKFFENIRVAAVRGFALDLEECSEGLCCVGAPVFDETGELAAALSVSGPAFRLSESRIEGDLVPLVTSIADRLSRSLGYAS